MSKAAVMAGWSDAPHLSREAQAELASSYMPHERDARTKGVPSLGAGAIYPVPEGDITVEPFALPAWYRHVYGLDVGWNRTAAVWGALDPETDVLYLYSEHYRAMAEPAIHAQAILSRGAWIPGVVDPAARGRSQIDGTQMLGLYQSQGLATLQIAENAVEAGIYAVWTRLSTGRLKVFTTLQSWLGEFRIYRRSEQKSNAAGVTGGKVVKEHDHLMDATRYLVMSGVRIAAQRPPEQWAERMGMAKGHQTAYDPLGRDTVRADYAGSHESNYDPLGRGR
jgi:hypothetical protein